MIAFYVVSFQVKEKEWLYLHNLVYRGMLDLLISMLLLSNRLLVKVGL